MSKRSDIIDGRQSHLKYGLIYTEVLGWIDLGHAQGTDIRTLLRSIDSGEYSDKERYDVTYSQSMIDPTRTMSMGKFITWRIKRGRSYFERRSIALAMMMSLARKFEGLQASFPINFVTDSGFSGEDLVSDLLGFYRVVTMANPFELLRPVSKAEALKDGIITVRSAPGKMIPFCHFYSPTLKNSLMRGLERFLPNFMTTFKPWSDFHSGIVGIASADGSYIDIANGETLPYA